MKQRFCPKSEWHETQFSISVQRNSWRSVLMGDYHSGEYEITSQGFYFMYFDSSYFLSIDKEKFDKCFQEVT